MRFVFLATLVIYTLNLVGRFLHFQMWPLPAWIDTAIDALLTANVQLLMLDVFLAPYVIALCGLIFLAASRIAFFEKPFFKNAFFVLLTLGVVPLNALLDGSPQGLAVYLLILLLMCPIPTKDPRYRRLVRIGLLVLFVSLQVLRTSVPGDVPYVGVAILVGLLVLLGQQRGWSSPQQYLSAIAVLAILMLAIGMVPQAVFEEPLVAGGRVILSSSGQAYSFCYLPETKQLFSAVNPSRDLSHLERIDLIGGERISSVTRIPVFDDADPKLRQIDCDASNVYFSDKRDNGRRSVGVVSIASGEILTHSLFDQEAGNTFVHVAERNRIFFFPEAGDSYVELQTTTGEQTVHPFDVYGHPLVKFLPLPIASFLTNLQAYSLDRRAIYVNHFLSGSEISEIDYDDGRVRRTLRTYNGLNHSLTVDRRYDRLIVSGLWGVEFIDLESGNVVQRHRTELDARAPVIDEENDLVYVPTHFGRYLYVFERGSMRFVGKLLVGSGARNCILTDSYLVLSSRNAVYALKREDLRRWAAGKAVGAHLDGAEQL